MKVVELKASNRNVLGKSVKKLRQNGIIPAHLFGHKVTSTAIQVESGQLNKILAEVGIGHLLTLVIDGSGDKRDVIIKELQKDVISRKPIHVDFYQVSATEKIELDVPINLVGESPAMKMKMGNLIINLKNIKVTCLPRDIPYSIPVDISQLANIGDSVHVENLKLPEGVTVVTDPREMIIKVQPLRVEEEKVVKEAEAKVEEKAEEATKAEEGAEAGTAKEASSTT